MCSLRERQPVTYPFNIESRQEKEDDEAATEKEQGSFSIYVTSDPPTQGHEIDHQVKKEEEESSRSNKWDNPVSQSKEDDNAISTDVLFSIQLLESILTHTHWRRVRHPHKINQHILLSSNHSIHTHCTCTAIIIIIVVNVIPFVRIVSSITILLFTSVSRKSEQHYIDCILLLLLLQMNEKHNSSVQ